MWMNSRGDAVYFADVTGDDRADAQLRARKQVEDRLGQETMELLVEGHEVVR